MQNIFFRQLLLVETCESRASAFKGRFDRNAYVSDMMPILVLGLLSLLVLGCSEKRTLTKTNTKTNTKSNYRPQKHLPAQPAITEFELRTTEQVGDELNPTSLVLGVEIDGQARAYPINMLTGPSREIINDTLGETRFAATW